MNLHVFIIHISIALLILPGTFSKTLSERNQIDSENETDEDKNSDEAELHETHHHSFKHAKADHINKHARRGRSSLQEKRKFAIMYNQEEPVGILQHFHDSYQLLPIHTDETIPVDVSPVEDESEERDAKKREIDEESQNEDLQEFADEKYPYIFAKFKIDTKVEKENQKARALEKRESKLTKKRPLFNDKHINSLNSALSRVQNNDEAASVELRSILHDMGLIDEPHLDKREAELMEDENLEHGTNKINLIKVDNSDESKPKPAKRSNEGKSTTKHYEMIQYPEPKQMDEEKVIDEYMNQMQQSQESDKEREKRASDDIAEQMERKIKEKLQKIKEEVRSEIDKLKANNNDEVNEDVEKDLVDEDEGKVQRRKRNIINTLVEEETSDLNPVIVGDENPAPHVRRRRSLYPSQEATEGRHLNRNLLEVSDDEDFQDFEDVRDKRSCKCEGGAKDCKCGKPKSYLVGPDGSNFVYFDGAPMLLQSPLRKKVDLPESVKPARESLRKRDVSHLKDGKYKLDLHPDSYEITKDNSDWVNTFRKKRSGFLDLVAVHGGGPILDHLVAVRQRSMLPKMRQKRMTQMGGRPLTLIDMSENDLFGAEPENFEGDELVRLKRVRREP